MVDSPVTAAPPPAPPGPPSSPEPAPAPARPLRSRYVLVVLLPLVALVTALLWLFAVNQAVQAEFDAFPGGGIPGQATVWVNPGTWYVYATTGTTVGSVTVTEPGGRVLPVHATPAVTVSQAREGRDFRAIGEFTADVGQVGDVRVAVTGFDPYGSGHFAVGDFNVSSFERFQYWTAVALLLINVGAAVAIAVVPLVRYRRSRTRTAGG